MVLKNSESGGLEIETLKCIIFGCETGGSPGKPGQGLCQRDRPIVQGRAKPVDSKVMVTSPRGRRPGGLTGNPGCRRAPFSTSVGAEAASKVAVEGCTDRYPVPCMLP